MARTTKSVDEVQRLEDTITYLRRDLAARRQPPGDFPANGCGGSACEVRTPTGMQAGCQCHCDERTLRSVLRWYKRKVEFAEATIEDMRGTEAKLRCEQQSELMDAYQRGRDDARVDAVH